MSELEIKLLKLFYHHSSISLAKSIHTKLHRLMLTRYDSVFTTMFSLPQDEIVNEEGTDDEHPIVLANDTADDFSGFIWVLYAE